MKLGENLENDLALMKELDKRCEKLNKKGSCPCSICTHRRKKGLQK